MNDRIIVLRVDVDFHAGLERGVPALLDDLKGHGAHAGFYVVMGPDTMHRHGARVREKGYIGYIMSIHPLRIVRAVGLARILLGRFLPPRPVGPSFPGILRRIREDGHDLGVHGFDHYWWASGAFTAETPMVVSEIDRAWEAFSALTGSPPVTWASPSWKTTDGVIRHLAGKGVGYMTECRGAFPFFTLLGDGSCVRIPHLPVSLPALNELAHMGYAGEAAVEELVRRMEGQEYNMLVIHCYYEGLMERGTWLRLLDRVSAAGYRVVSPSEYLAAHAAEAAALPCCPLRRARLEGGVSVVSYQGAPRAAS